MGGYFFLINIPFPFCYLTIQEAIGAVECPVQCTKSKYKIDITRISQHSQMKTSYEEGEIEREGKRVSVRDSHIHLYMYITGLD